MDNIERAKELLTTGCYTCALCRDDYTYFSNDRGVKPLLLLLDSGNAPKGFSAADKVVGRAAAFLYVLLGAGEVYADVMSCTAEEVLDRYSVKHSCGKRVETIFNRTLTGLCPMESSVLNISEPAAALAAIKAKVKELSGK